LLQPNVFDLRIGTFYCSKGYVVLIFGALMERRDIYAEKET